MKKIAVLAATLLAAAWFAQNPPASRSDVAMQSAQGSSPVLKQLTPVLVVDAVEPCIAFWVERFGFTAANPVPGPDGKLIFASAEKGGVEVMYQTRASVIADQPEMEKELQGRSIVLFITVEDIDAVQAALAGVPLVKPRHDTFYGSTEIYVREPGGHTVGFAQMGTAPAQ
jgi:uncharacterized glyoxalase superfamily protein PhnB